LRNFLYIRSFGCFSYSHTNRSPIGGSDFDLKMQSSEAGEPSSHAFHSKPFNDAGRKQDDSDTVTWMSLPHKPQLFILALCRLSEPLSNTCLLPYLYYLIRSLQSSSTSGSISRQGGLLVALFALSQFATSMPWAWIANHWGRKPSVVIGLTLSIIANLGFGFSKTIPAAMCWRVVAGIGNGNIGVMRTMTAEIVKEKKYQGRAFLLLPLVFNSGMVIGLALGGCLADPITNLPWLFGPNGWLNLAHDPEGVAWMREYSYALPTMFNAAVLSCSLILAVCGLRETMPGKTDGKDYGLLLGRRIRHFLKSIFLRNRNSEYMAVQADDGDGMEHELLEHGLSKLPPSVPNISTARNTPVSPKSFWTREVLYTLVSVALLPLHNAAFMQVFPVFLSTPVSSSTFTSIIKFNGGLGLPSSTIGLFLSAFGIFGILIQLFIYPRLQAAFGTLWNYRLALSIFPLAYILAPYLALIPSSWHFFFQALGIAFILFLQVGARTFAIPSSVILLTNSAPTPRALSTIHGAGNMLSSLSRAVGPALGGVVYAWGIEREVIGVVWWGYLTVIAVIGLGWSWSLKEGEGFNRGAANGEGKNDIELLSKGSESVKSTDEEKR
jgi:predicted MFS family arabinose efflux permease